MPSLDKRIAKLEDAFMQHITESGEIRADLKWLRKAFWMLAGVGTTTMAGLILELLIRPWR